MKAAWIKRLAWIVVAVAALIALPWHLIQPGEIRTDYCAECACQHQTQNWTIRYTRRTLWTRETETSTLVSAALTEKRLVGPHTHHWVAPQVVANPLSPYLPPVRISLGFINTSLVVSLLRNMSDFADPASAQHVREVILQPEYSYLINHNLRFHKFPPRGFNNRLQFLNWWQQNAFSFFDHLRDETVPD